MTYEDSEFHNIFPDWIDSQRKRLIGIFEKAILDQPTNISSLTSPTAGRPSAPYQPGPIASDFNQPPPQYQHTNFNQIYQSQNEEKKQESDTEIEKGDVDDEDHPRYRKTAQILYGCAKMIMQPGREPKEDKDLKCLSSILDVNTVLLLSDILCRQYLVPLYHPNEEKMNGLLQALTSTQGAMKSMIPFIRNQYALQIKLHNESKFEDYVSNALNVLKAHRWLGYAQPPVLGVNEDEYESDQENDIDEISSGKLKCNARDVQIYVFAFLIGTTRMLIKNFEDTNVQIMLDMKFPTDVYKPEEGTMGSQELWDKSLEEIQSKIIGFQKCFEDPNIRGHIRDKIRREHALIIQTIDFSKDKAHRFNASSQNDWTLNEKHIGFPLDERTYKTLYDKCELFQLLRAKRYVMMTGSATRDVHDTFDHNRVSISLHKFGMRMKFYMHFKGGVFRMRMEDLCSWFPKMFRSYSSMDTSLQWDFMKRYLRRVLKDNQDLVPTNNNLIGNPLNQYYYNGQSQPHPLPPRINFWSNIKSWSDLDDNYYQQCDKFTYKMREKYNVDYGDSIPNIFDENIVDNDRVLKSLKERYLNKQE